MGQDQRRQHGGRSMSKHPVQLYFLLLLSQHQGARTKQYETGVPAEEEERRVEKKVRMS